MDARSRMNSDGVALRVMCVAGKRGAHRLWVVAAIGLAAAAAVTALPRHLVTAAAVPAPAPNIYFITSHHANPKKRSRPTAGHLFTGLTIISESTVPAKFTSVKCGARAGHAFLRARKNFFFAPGPPYVETIVCSWSIPAEAAGKRLVLSGPAGTHRAEVVVKTKGGQKLDAASPQYSWHVQKR